MNLRHGIGIALLAAGVAAALFGIGGLSRGYSVFGSASGGAAIFLLALAWRALVDRPAAETTAEAPRTE